MVLQRRTFYGVILILALAFVVGCSASDIPASSPPTAYGQPTQTAPSTATPTAEPQSAATPAAIPTLPLPAAETSATRPAILDVFPLSAGATWVYSITVDDVAEYHWTGLVTETITAGKPQGLGSVFQSDLQGHPFRTQPVDRLHSYVVLDGSVYKVPGTRDPLEFVATEGQSFGVSQILVWPLAVGQKWGPPEFLTRDVYVWRVETQESVSTPAGRFDGCYRLSFDWIDSRQLAWFCPGTGIVRWETHHHGTRHDEVWELREFRPVDTSTLAVQPAPAQTATSIAHPSRSLEFAKMSDAQEAATFSLLTPAFVPDNLPFYKAWVSDYDDGSQNVRLLYTVPSDKLDANQKALDVQLTKTDAPVTLDSVTHQFRETASDVREVQVRGQVGYTYWSPAGAAGNSAVLTWREGNLNVKVTLFGAWPQPDEKSPHRLDSLLMKIAQSLQATPAQIEEAPTQATTATPVPVATWSSTSPDGKWIAQGMMEGPFMAGDDEKYHYRLKVVSADRRIEWTAVDETAHWGLGYTTPRPFHWSRDGRYLYFTNEPVPDGCAVFVNGSDLKRLDLTTGRVQEMLPPKAWWLSLSPDETKLAYIYWNGEALEIVLRDLATGAERRAKLDASLDDSQAGSIVWSPDGKALMLTVAIHPCDTANWANSVVRVETATLSQRVLIRQDKRLYVTQDWPEADKVLLKDNEGNSWRMDAMTGQVTAAK